ncbi:galactose-specific lectin nattectin-like isoform X3 [Branchiostoma floridae x Branchiostoma belcheri]
MAMKSVLVILAVLMSLQETSGQTININVNMPEGGEKSAAAQEKIMKLEFKNALLELRVSDLSKALCACNNKTHVCPSGYTKHCDMCYSFSADTKNYADARSACHAAGGHLAMPKDQATNDFLVQHIRSWYRRAQVLRYGFYIYRYRIWFGLTDQVKEGIWVWEDGTTLGTTGWSDWYTGRPVAYVSGRNCAAWSSLGFIGSIKWQGFRCLEIWPFVCEKRATVIP